MRRAKTLIHNTPSCGPRPCRTQLLGVLLLSWLFLAAAPPPAMAGAPEPDLNLTPEEMIWLHRNRDSILYGPNPYWPPGDYM